MLNLGGSEFDLAVPSLPETELRHLSTSLFATWEAFVDTALALPDYSLFLQVEEGSVRGSAKIAAVAGVLYLGIGNYGDFISGLKTIGEQLGATSEYLAVNAKRVFKCPDEKALTRKRGGAVAGLQRLFVRVQSGELSPEEAMALAERLLGDERDNVPGLMRDLYQALRDCPRFHKQESLPLSLEELVPPSSALAPEPTPNRRERLPRPDLAPPLQFRVEVWRDSKKKRRQTRVIKL